MPDYGVTEKGFVIKRMDVITEEVNAALTEGFGIDTALSENSFLEVLVTTFCGQIADLWETAQDSYYAKFPATAMGVNLDNAVQFGGIRRSPNKQTCYPLHCTGDDGTLVREMACVATDTKPEIKLVAANDFYITRESFNIAKVKIAVSQIGIYTITINGEQYSYSSKDGKEESILHGLAAAINNAEYEISRINNTIEIKDSVLTRNNVLMLSDNLTTESVTTIANFFTEDYGKITLPNGIVSKIVNNVVGFEEVTNLLEPTYGRVEETDIELRHSYLAKSALRSTTMVESIIAELLNSVPNVETVSGYENDTDVTDIRGLPPHSIEIVVEGGSNEKIAEVILKKKAGGIQTYGAVTVNVPGKYGESIPIHFNRPEFLYTWMKVNLYGNTAEIPQNYAALTVASIIEDGENLVAGKHLLIQLLHEGIYSSVAGVTYVDISIAYSSDRSYIPVDSDYNKENIIVTARQKVMIDKNRIEVMCNEFVS